MVAGINQGTNTTCIDVGLDQIFVASFAVLLDYSSMGTFRFHENFRLKILAL